LRSDRERLKDIRESIVRIEMHAPKSVDELHSDVVLQGFVIHELQVIGEAVSRLRLSLKVQYDDVPWNRIVSMRNAMVHAYHAVDLSIVWNVVNVDVPILKAAVERMLEENP